MSTVTNISDAKAYRQGCAFADRQMTKLMEICPEAKDTEVLRSSETMFMWGVFSELTEDDKRTFRLLAKFLRERANVDPELCEAQAAFVCSATKWNDMAKEISSRGRIAFKQNDDDQLGQAISILIERLGLGVEACSPARH